MYSQIHTYTHSNIHAYLHTYTHIRMHHAHSSQDPIHILLDTHMHTHSSQDPINILLDNYHITGALDDHTNALRAWHSKQHEQQQRNVKVRAQRVQVTADTGNKPTADYNIP